MTDTRPRLVTDLSDLIQVVELTGVITYEQCAKRHDNGIEAGDDPDPQLEAYVRGFEGGLEARFKMTYQGPGYVVISDLGLRYENREEYQLEHELIADFLSEVAVMAAYPYLREGVTTSAARLGMGRPVLGIVRRGDIQFGRVEDVEEKADGAAD